MSLQGVHKTPCCSCSFSLSFLLCVWFCAHHEVSPVFMCLCFYVLLIDRSTTKRLEPQSCFRPQGFLKRRQCDTWYVGFRKGMWSITCWARGVQGRVRGRMGKRSFSLLMKIRKMLELITVNKWLSPCIHQFCFFCFSRRPELFPFRYDKII